MKTDNELIAEFMGLSRHNKEPHLIWVHDHGYACFVTKDKLLYHTSWDWLMPVVEKISQLDGEYTVAIYTQKEPSLDGHECSIYDIGHAVDIGFCSKDLINCIYVTIVDFIKWYNNHHTP